MKWERKWNNEEMRIKWKGKWKNEIKNEMKKWNKNEMKKKINEKRKWNENVHFKYYLCNIFQTWINRTARHMHSISCSKKSIYNVYKSDEHQ